MNELAEDGDEIVAIRVLELDEDGESTLTTLIVLGEQRSRSDRFLAEQQVVLLSAPT
jgi:hypothetical protein